MQTVVIPAADKVFDDVDVEHDSQENKQGEDDEVFHGFGIRLRISFAFVLGKDKGFVGIPEGLDEHHHHHGNLEAGAVDT